VSVRDRANRSQPRLKLVDHLKAEYQRKGYTYPSEADDETTTEDQTEMGDQDGDAPTDNTDRQQTQDQNPPDQDDRGESSRRQQQGGQNNDSDGQSNDHQEAENDSINPNNIGLNAALISSMNITLTHPEDRFPMTQSYRHLFYEMKLHQALENLGPMSKYSKQERITKARNYYVLAAKLQLEHETRFGSGHSYPLRYPFQEPPLGTRIYPALNDDLNRKIWNDE